MAIIRTVIIEWNNSEHTDFTIINENYYIDDTNLPPSGLSPEHECLVPYIPFEAPDYDPRIHILQTIKTPTTNSHPLYSAVNQWLITYNIVKRPNSDIKLSIESAKNNANEQAFPIQKQLEYVVVGLNALKKYVLGQNLTAKEQVVNQRITAYANSLLANSNNEEALNALVDSGAEPNIDEGWTIETV